MKEFWKQNRLIFEQKIKCFERSDYVWMSVDLVIHWDDFSDSKTNLTKKNIRKKNGKNNITMDEL